MIRAVRCRRCGAAFALTWTDVVGRVTRLCPRCRGSLPPTGGGVPVAADGIRPGRVPT